ncbi:MAG: serine/threonine-protein kinase [Kofleriaceae bacterium]|nr:serine/threonine-protein kinase [Kofleriaceae bacterium]
MISREPKPSRAPAQGGARPQAALETSSSGDAMIVNVSGLIDERFPGFGDVGEIKTVIINVSGMTRMTSFGVRQWINAMQALPKTVSDLYLLGCPTFFVDQLNMVLNFGGTAKVLTVVAPYACPACGNESGEIIDVLEERAHLAKGAMPDKNCSKCKALLEFDEMPESYFAFVSKYAATSLAPAAAKLLSQKGLYASAETGGDRPPKIIKLVHGSVTYFRIAGTMASNFRARPLLVGAEGEVVIDLADVERFDTGAHKEWRRLLRSLSAQVPAVTLVDLSASFFANAADTLMFARNIAVATVLVPYQCTECGKGSEESVAAAWPLQLTPRVCTTCGGTTHPQFDSQAFSPLHKVSTQVAAASAKLIAQRDEILSRAMTDARVAEAGNSASASLGADDTILGKYKIVRPLSEGGMAEVFLAKQVGLEKPVALKRIQRKLLDTRHLAIDMFLNEAKIAGRLTHPNIVQVLDVGEVGGALYLAMEYVHGRDLREIISKYQKQQLPMPLGEICMVIREVATALHHAYFSTDIDGKQLSVVHRDVSPQNIILGYDGGVKLLDFGVAMSSVTEHEAGMIVGKWRYISPEATTKTPIDHRADLFSLGVILYLLCAGVAPFSGRDPKDIVKKIRAAQYRPLREVAPHVPVRLAGLCESLLQPAPEHRPQSGMEVVAQLNEIMREEGYAVGAAQIAQLVTTAFPIAPSHDVPQIEIFRPSLSDSNLSRVSGSMSISPAQRLSALTRSPELAAGSNEPLVVPPQPLRMQGVQYVVPQAVAQEAARPDAPKKPMSPKTIAMIALLAIVVIVAMYLIVRPI